MVAQEVLSADHQSVDTQENGPVGTTTSHESKPKCDNPENKQTETAPTMKKKRKNLQAGVKDAVWLGIFTLVTAFVGATMRGDWILLLVHILKQWHPDYQDVAPSASGTAAPAKDFVDYLENAHIVVTLSVVVSFVTYYGVGGYLQYAFYIKRKDQAHEWKCQPTRWLTAENERHEILLGSTNMLLGGAISGVFATYILNGGPSMMYFNAGEHGYLYLVLSTILVFLFQDGAAYYVHRLSHIPMLYKRIHKHHHRYHSPTAFSASAMHPFEFVAYQCIFASPMFFVPIYSGAFVMLLFYGYYYGMVDHSGIMMEAVWPWQPESLFHDDHHKYFHTNFGFNTKLWDWLHDTLRQETRVYGENIFYGKGQQSKDQ